jgi:hypothetical protein
LVPELEILAAEAILREVNELTADLIAAGLCIDQNYPTLSRELDDVVVIGFSALNNLSITLKNIPYPEIYETLSANRSYNIRLIDGGIVQMLYQFQGGGLQKHRLAFFPSPDLLEYQNNSEIYDQDEMYGDVVFRNVVTTPIRFDFDRDAFVDYDHPMSHMTIGQYKNCRIPVAGPLTPYFFINFILRAFYNTPFRKFCGEIRERTYPFSDTITQRERRHLHVRVCD